MAVTFMQGPHDASLNPRTQVDGSDIDIRVNQAAGFIMDMAQRRVTFNVGGGHTWAMRFPTADSFK